MGLHDRAWGGLEMESGVGASRAYVGLFGKRDTEGERRGRRRSVWQQHG